MGKIKELTTVLADQIAAGEVIERPASVVKELVENAIDAKSTQIDVNITQAGLEEIEVIDNGIGILKDDIEIAFKRHATSKIKDRNDLFKVKTLGFRGEALPSIASVSDVCLQSSTNQDVGTLIHVLGGRIIDKKIADMRKGTRVKVSKLFYNTPARLKYLSSKTSELAAIVDILNRLAISHTNIAFSLNNDGKELLQTIGNGNLKQTIGAIYGVNNARKMVSFSDQDLDFEVNGYVSLPELTRASKKYMTILINGRYIKNFNLTKKIIAGYGSKLMIGRYPIAVLNIKLDPILVDVNVHPTKKEVRLSKEESLGDLVQKTIFESLKNKNLIPNALTNLKKSENKLDLEQLKLQLKDAKKDFSKENNGTSLISEKIDNRITSIIIEDKKQLQSNLVKNWDKEYGSIEQDSTFEKSSDKPKEIIPKLKYIGQMHGTYLLAQADDGLYILDQHAAQERINYEYYREEIGKIGTMQQSLLVPIIIDYPASDALVIKSRILDLEKLGIMLEIFGPNTFAIRTHPAWMTESKEESIKEMIDYFLNNHKLTLKQFREKTAIMMSCKRAIKANHYLDDRQAIALIEKLKQCENPYNCPHGRPTVVKFTNKDLEHMFKRIQETHKSIKDF